MSRVAEGLRKAAEARRDANDEPTAPQSAVEKLLPLRRDSLETPWRLEEARPDAASTAESHPPLSAHPLHIATTGPTVTSQTRGRTPVFAGGSALRNFSTGMRQQIAGLVERVFLPASGDAVPCVAFAAVGADVGSASVVAAVAETLAIHTSGSVCVVDANFANPALHDCFGIANEAGLTDALVSGCALSDLVQPVSANLFVLPAGAGEVRPSLAADYPREQVAQLAKTFQYVLVHTEPIGSAGETGGIAPVVNGVVLIVAAEHTRRDMGRSVVDNLRGSGVRVIGAVLMNQRFPLPHFLYRWL